MVFWTGKLPLFASLVRRVVKQSGRRMQLIEPFDRVRLRQIRRTLEEMGAKRIRKGSNMHLLVSLSARDETGHEPADVRSRASRADVLLLIAADGEPDPVDCSDVLSQFPDLCIFVLRPSGKVCRHWRPPVSAPIAAAPAVFARVDDVLRAIRDFDDPGTGATCEP